MSLLLPRAEVEASRDDRRGTTSAPLSRLAALVPGLGDLETALPNDMLLSFPRGPSSFSLGSLLFSFSPGSLLVILIFSAMFL